METNYKTLLFYEIVKFVTEYLDNSWVECEAKYENIDANYKSQYKQSCKIIFSIGFRNIIEVVHNQTDDVVYIVCNTNAFSFVVFSKNEITQLIAPVILDIKQGK